MNISSTANKALRNNDLEMIFNKQLQKISHTSKKSTCYEVIFNKVKDLCHKPANVYLFKVNNRNTSKVWNMFKVNNKNTSTTSPTSFLIDHQCLIRSNGSQVYHEKAYLRNFVKFTRKCLCCSLFLVKLQTHSLQV